MVKKNKEKICLYLFVQDKFNIICDVETEQKRIWLLMTERKEHFKKGR